MIFRFHLAIILDVCMSCCCSCLTFVGSGLHWKGLWSSEHVEVAMTFHLYIFASKAFVNTYSFIFMIFLACWYLYYLFDSSKDKLCLLKHLNLYFWALHILSQCLSQRLFKCELFAFYMRRLWLDCISLVSIQDISINKFHIRTSWPYKEIWWEILQFAFYTI